MILYGGSQVLAGDTTPGAFFSFVAALLFAYRPLKTLANLHTQVQVGLAAAERIYGLLDRPPSVRDQAGAKPLVVRARRDPLRRRALRLRAPGGRPCAGSSW